MCQQKGQPGGGAKTSAQPARGAANDRHGPNAVGPPHLSISQRHQIASVGATARAHFSIIGGGIHHFAVKFALMLTFNRAHHIVVPEQGIVWPYIRN